MARLPLGPITSRALVGSLVGPDGYFYASTKEFAEHAKLDEVEMEIRAQIERAKSMDLSLRILIPTCTHSMRRLSCLGYF